MKKTILAFLFIGILFIAGCTTELPKQEVYYPEATGYVVDSADIISPEVEKNITNELENFKKAQIAVVTIRSTQPLSIEEYGIKLAEKWGVGNEEKDNGIIFIIATEDRKVRIEVGYGLEGIINDAKAGRILDEKVIPFLKKNQWQSGVLSGTGELIRVVESYENN